MTEIPMPTGSMLVEDADLAHLDALHTLTGRSHAELFTAAIERLRHDLVPSTRPPAAERKTRRAKP